MDDQGQEKGTGMKPDAWKCIDNEKILRGHIHTRRNLAEQGVEVNIPFLGFFSTDEGPLQIAFETTASVAVFVREHFIDDGVKFYCASDESEEELTQAVLDLAVGDGASVH